MDVEELRSKARDWLASNAPIAGRTYKDSYEEVLDARAFQRKLHEGGLAAVTWPPEYGGQGLTPAHERAYREEAATYAVPTDLLLIGLSIVAPTILALGTDDQKKRLLPGLSNGDLFGCQLFSEPAAGSDVAGLRTRAVNTPEGWVVNGQKIWTTHAQLANFGLLLARTDADQPKHKGITMFVLDMKTPGVRVRPLRDMTGGARFNEVFMDDVLIPHDCVLGEVGAGWGAALTMLSFERLAIGDRIRPRTHAVSFSVLAATAAESGAVGGDVKTSLIDLYLAERRAELFASGLSRETRAGYDPGARGSVGKLLNSALAAQCIETAQDVLGPRSVLAPGDDEIAALAAHAISEKHSWSIAGGTSEIQRNIVGEHVLGLAREPQVDRGIPFRDLDRSTGRTKE